MLDKPVNILIVDDVPANLLVLRALLNHPKYHLVEAASGEEALELLLNQQDYALILMDVVMPGLNGFETVELIKSRRKCEDIPVIFLTANSKEEQQIYQGYETGAIDYITKPYDSKVLQAKVSAFVEIYHIQLNLKVEVERRILAEHDLRLASQVFEHAGEGMIITNNQTVIEAVNPMFVKITGYSADEVIGKTPKMFSSGRQPDDFYQKMWAAIATEGVWEGEIKNRRKNGDIYSEWLKIVGIKNKANEITHYIGSFSDITSRTSARQRLYHLAHYDTVTQLPNRLLFSEVLEHELKRAKRRQTILAVFFMDLDHFKDVNDTLGHAAGDDLLKVIANRLLSCKRDNDLVARQGGDEFTGVLVELSHAEDAALVIQRMLDELAVVIQLGASVVHISGSIGVSVFPDDGEDVETLMRKADAAMYHAKERGRANYQFYTEKMHQNSLHRISLKEKIFKAIQDKEFELYYQPQSDSKTGRVMGLEALIRWNQPDVGMISPVDFIPLAEDTGLIVPIGAWVLRSACMQMQHWNSRVEKPLVLSVNVSSYQFRDTDFIQVLKHVLIETGIKAEHLKLELTEGVVMQDDALTASRLEELHKLGIILSIDDFGTGYSSLSYLKKFPIQELKIDRSFIDGLCQNGDDTVIVESMIHLAHGLKLTVVAEGVEDEAQLHWLRKHDCDVIQGYFLSKPLPAEDVSLFLTQHEESLSASLKHHA